MLSDASKAFYKVNYMKLFNLLVKKGFCPPLCRLLLHKYKNQVINIKDVTVTNRVKQGGILSPTLFTIYINVLFRRQKYCCLGCYVGNNFMGALGYADDIALIASSIMALKRC